MCETKGFNENGIGIVFVGNYNQMIPPMGMWYFARPVIRAFMTYFEIPVERVIAHRETYAHLDQGEKKTCPGRLWNIDQFRAFIG